jgi:hypothetical protein
MQAGLKQNGFLVVKENIAKQGEYMAICMTKVESIQHIRIWIDWHHFLLSYFIGFVVDKVDSSVTRSDLYFRELFEQTGLHLYKTKVRSTNWRNRILSGMTFFALKS